jgi:hypothetical protein
MNIRYPYRLCWSYIGCLLLLLLCSACIKEIDFTLGKSDGQLVINGTFADQPGRHIFRITRTNSFEKQVDAEAISGATLQIVDSKARVFPFLELEPGTYLFKDTLYRAKVGEQYYLDIKLPDGSHYRSDVEVMPAPLKMEKVYPRVIVNGNDQALRIMADVSIPQDNQGVFLRWDTRRVWRRTSIDFAYLFNDSFRFRAPKICYMTEDPEPNTVRLFSSRRRDAFLLREQEVLRMPPDSKFFERNAIQVIQYRISEKTHQYWSDINQVGNPNGTIFDLPPASVKGNIYNVNKPKERTLGYFEVAALDTAATAFERDVFTYPISDPCLVDYTNAAWRATYGYHPECAFCVNIPGHSLKVPSFWR